VKRIYTLILGFMCFFLAMGICVQVRTIKDSQTVVAKTSTESDLRNNILRLKEKYNEKYDALEKANKKLNKYIKDISDSDSQNIDYPNDLKKLNSSLGYTDLEGPGIVITVEDGDMSTVKGNVSNYWVHDGDLFKIVNLLKAGGAEAISINDERIVPSTAITCAGNIVKINNKKVGSPFVITAIGLSEKLYGMVTVSDDYLKEMELEGVKIKIEKKDKVFIKKFNGVYRFNYAKNIE